MIGQQLPHKATILISPFSPAKVTCTTTETLSPPDGLIRKTGTGSFSLVSAQLRIYVYGIHVPLSYLEPCLVDIWDCSFDLN